jgi:hypothetical protein
MSAFATLSLKNQAGTEVNYSPADIDQKTGVARYLGAGAVYDERPQVTVSVSYPSGKGTKIRVRGKISFPVMDPVDTTKKVDEQLALFEFSLAKNSALASRQNLRAAIADFLTDTVVVKAIEDFESVY